MPVGRAAVALAASVALAGCPKKPPPDEEPVLSVEMRPTLARDFAEVTADLYPEFVELADWRILPTVGQLMARHDTERWTRREATWGEPSLQVVEFIDTDRPHTDLSAIAAWVLTEPEEQDSGDALLPVRSVGVAPSRRVRAVLLRDFTGAPYADAPESVMLALQERFPPPWTLCTPAEDEARSVAYDPKRGLKFGLVHDESKAEGGWTVDHVEFLSPGFVPEEWWAAKGYGECVGTAAMDAQGRVRKLRRPR